MYLLEEVFSPIITPLVLCFSVRRKSLEIVDFFRNFTVEVTGVGDVCSFAQMDIRRHGNPQVRENYITAHVCGYCGFFCIKFMFSCNKIAFMKKYFFIVMPKFCCYSHEYSTVIVSPVRSTYGGYYGLVVVTPRPRPPRPRPRPQTLHRSHDNLKNPYRIASIFYM